MIGLLQSLNLSHQTENAYCADTHQQSIDACNSMDFDGWLLLPMLSSTNGNTNAHQQSKSDLTSTTLGDKLIDALERSRRLLKRRKQYDQDINNNNNNDAVLFLGMDSPELPIKEIVHGLQIAHGKSNIGKAHLCPADDGGYGLLSVPHHAPSSCIFTGVRWSTSLTAVSQLKALSDSNVDVSVGRLMHDIDEAGDVQKLAMRLAQGDKRKTQVHDVLTEYSSGIIASDTTKPNCYHTMQTLVDLGVLLINGDDTKQHTVNSELFDKDS